MVSGQVTRDFVEAHRFLMFRDEDVDADLQFDFLVTSFKSLLDGDYRVDFRRFDAASKIDIFSLLFMPELDLNRETIVDSLVEADQESQGAHEPAFRRAQLRLAFAKTPFEPAPGLVARLLGI
jgi:hypothetical protein